MIFLKVISLFIILVSLYPSNSWCQLADISRVSQDIRSFQLLGRHQGNLSYAFFKVDQLMRNAFIPKVEGLGSTITSGNPLPVPVPNFESYGLSRISLQMGLSRELGAMFFAHEKHQMVEIIWEKDPESIQERNARRGQRQESQKVRNDQKEQREISISYDVESNFQIIKNDVEKVLEEQNIDRKHILRILGALYDQTEELTRLAVAVKEFGELHDWRVNRIFKIFYLNFGGSQNDFSAEQTIRVRYRFFLPFLPVRFKDSERVYPFSYDNGKERLFEHLTDTINHIESLRKSDHCYARLQLDRVWDQMRTESFFHLRQINLSMGHGTTLEYLHLGRAVCGSDFNYQYESTNPLRSLIDVATHATSYLKRYPISQIRVKSLIRNKFFYGIGTLRKSHDLQYHYRI